MKSIDPRGQGSPNKDKEIVTRGGSHFEKAPRQYDPLHGFPKLLRVASRFEFLGHDIDSRVYDASEENGMRVIKRVPNERSQRHT